MSAITKIASAHCANWQNSLCSGIGFRKEGSLYRLGPENQKCSLVDHKRCTYFEQCVLPIGKNKEWSNKYPAEARSLEQGADQYFRLHAGIAGLAAKRRTCPDCGVQIGSRSRYCAECRKRRRNQTDAANHRAHRQKEGVSVIQLTKILPSEINKQK